MRRPGVWFAAMVVALGGAAVWVYRDQRANAEPDGRAERAVANAYTLGRRVALSGKQTVALGETREGAREVTAEVLQSTRGETRIEYLSAPLKGVTIWETDDRTYRYKPSAQRLTVGTRRTTPEEAASQEVQLLRNYNARVTGSERVAGQKTMVVELLPRSGGDRWKRLWIDPDNWVTLAMEDRRGRTEILRSTRFSEVRYLTEATQPPADEFRPSTELIAKYGQARPGDTASRFDPKRLSELVEFQIREPKWLPAGYAFRGAYPTPCSCEQRHQAARLEYSDGLHSITLFECAHPRCTSKGNCFVAEGSSSPLSFSLEDATGRYLAIGDASKQELERFTRSAAR